jgi:hypothetical protein
MTNRRDHAERIAEAIRQVLVDDWDPIGVMDDPEWPRDEYDAYIGEIYRHLARGESAEFIADRLCAIEHSAMGLDKLQASVRLPVALKLKAIDISPHGMESPSHAGGL